MLVSKLGSLCTWVFQHEGATTFRVPWKVPPQRTGRTLWDDHKEASKGIHWAARFFAMTTASACVHRIELQSAPEPPFKGIRAKKAYE